MFAKVELLGDRLDGRLNRRDAHRGLRGGGVLSVASVGGEQPDRVAMREPESSQHLQRCRWQEQVAIFGSFAAMNVNHHSLAVDVTDLQADRLADPQAERIGRPNERLHANLPAGVDDLLDLRSRDHLGERAGVTEFRIGENLPISREGLAICSVRSLD